jgi:hypothetical protein
VVYKIINPPSNIIRYVERTEGLKFKQIPTVQYSRISQRGRNHLTMELDCRGKDKAVAKATVTINKRFSRPVEDKNHQYATQGADKLIMIHELRENLKFQNKPNISSKTAHKQALTQEPKDIAWLKKQGYVSKLSANKRSRNFF